jgi:hypothetical protein
MTRTVEVFTSVLAYATFASEDVRKSVEETLVQLDQDFFDSGFEPSDRLETKLSDLEAAMNDADEDGLLKDDGEGDEEDGEFAGLGEDDEE